MVRVGGVGNKPHRCGAGRAAVCAPAARGRGRESESSEAERARAERDSIADGTALRNIVGEEVAATFGDTEDLFPEGSLFVSLRATGYLLTRAACLLSVRLKKNVGTKRRPQAVSIANTLLGGKKKNVRLFKMSIIQNKKSLLKALLI